MWHALSMHLRKDEKCPRDHSISVGRNEDPADSDWTCIFFCAPKKESPEDESLKSLSHKRDGRHRWHFCFSNTTWLAVPKKTRRLRREGNPCAAYHLIRRIFESPGDRVMRSGQSEDRKILMLASFFQRPDPHEAELQGPGGSVIAFITDRIDLVLPQRLLLFWRKVRNNCDQYPLQPHSTGVLFV